MKHTNLSPKWKNPLLLFLAIAFSLPAFSQTPQSHLWNIASGYFSFVPTFPQTLTQLPQGFNTSDYHGAPPVYSSNAAHGANGDLLFFVVDGNIYDKNGTYVGFVGITGGAQGSAECVIVPVPDQCNQWLVINGFVDDINQTLTTASVEYSVITFQNQTPFIQPGGAGVVSLPPSAYVAKHDAVEMAVSPLTNNHTRLLYIHDGVDVFECTIDNSVAANGITGYSIFHNTSEAAGTALRSEMELVQLNTGEYRLAYPWFSPYANSPYASYGITTLKLDPTGTIVESSDSKYFDNGPVSFGNWKTPKGLEFSPSGQYLYMTHSGTTPIEYWDFNTNIVNTLDINLAGDLPSAYSNSQIERGFDNNDALFFASSAGYLSALLNPDFPSTANWRQDYLANNISVPITHNVPDQGNAVNLSIQMLPDQRDGEDYLASFNTSIQCCLSGTSFDEDSYAPSVFNPAPFNTLVQTWNPTHNPFGGTPATPVSTVTIRNNLSIPAGYVITISGMTFQFAPRTFSPVQSAGANVVVERWSYNNHILRGGKLILDNSKFTSYNSCGSGMLQYIEALEEKDIAISPSFVRSLSHQTEMYPCQPFYKPISKVIFNESRD